MKITKTIIYCFLGFGLITFGTLGKKAVAADFLQTTTTNNDSENVAILQKRLQASICQDFGGNPYICTFRVLNFLPIDQVVYLLLHPDKSVLV